eukprot:1159278-Pelagomonas_calceolata.AAC.4
MPLFNSLSDLYMLSSLHNAAKMVYVLFFEGHVIPVNTSAVLFCKLTFEQLELYRAYLASVEVSEILEGSRQALAGIDILRKICNHADLLERTKSAAQHDYGGPWTPCVLLFLVAP